MSSWDVARKRVTPDSGVGECAEAGEDNRGAGQVKEGSGKSRL